jgi:hypothetical protein
MKIFGSVRAQVRKHTTLDVQDAEFLKEKGIKIAHIVRDFCRRQREIDSGAYEASISEIKKRNDRIVKRLNKTFEVLGEMLTKEQFDELIQKI